MYWFKGYVICCIQSGSYERFFNACRHHKFHIKKIHISEESVLFYIRIQEYRKLASFSYRFHVVPRIQKKCGLPFWENKAFCHFTFVLGGLLFLGLLFIYSRFVWSIEFEGNHYYTEERLRKAIKQMEVYEGMKRSQLHCDALEKRLRIQYPDISWVSAEEVGSLLRIKIKEGKVTTTMNDTKNAAHLVTPISGTVISIVTSQGQPLVKKGTSVTEGQILIRGWLDIKDDSKEIVGATPVVASGSVIVAGERYIKKDYPNTYEEKVYSKNTWHVLTGSFFGKKITLKNPINKFDKSYKCDIITKVCVNLPFRIKTICPYQVKKRSYDSVSIKHRATLDFQKFSHEISQSGSEILSRRAVVKKTTTGWQLTGSLKVFQRTHKTQAVLSTEWSENPQNGNNGKRTRNSSEP